MKNYKKLVSILIPTRKRIKLLKECLDSLNTKTQDKSLVEILIKIDTDDQETIDFINQYKITSPIFIKEVITDRKKGWSSLDEHMNYLSSFSEAEFLLGFNDDVEMLTEGWEQQYIPYKEKNFFLAIHIESVKEGIVHKWWEGYNAFPTIPHDIRTYMGALQGHPMLDDWWEHVMRPIRDQGLDLNRWINVTILNKRPDGGEITNSPIDQTFIESRSHINWNHHNSPEVFEWSNKIIEYINFNPDKFIE
jgi:glycosyltransferase involved in cell wall biosynthesis